MALFARACNVSRRRLKFATVDECKSIFGYTPGCVPPMAHRAKTQVFVDRYNSTDSVHILVY